eukprot:UN02867
MIDFMSIQEAKEKCTSLETCHGFVVYSGNVEVDTENQKMRIWFKQTLEKLQRNSDDGLDVGYRVYEKLNPEDGDRAEKNVLLAFYDPGICREKLIYKIHYPYPFAGYYEDIFWDDYLLTLKTERFELSMMFEVSQCPGFIFIKQ